VAALHYPGDEVLIADGEFAGRIATVVEMHEESATVTITVFDRAVILEVPFSELLPPPDSGSGGVRGPLVPRKPSGSPGSTADAP
jgi:hypothetical protein